MPDEQQSTPIPAVMNVAEFWRRYGDEAACVEHLRAVRWGPNLERFTCPACGHAHGWWLPRRQLVECRDCHRQTSVTAGTVFHRVRSPLWKWFWAIYQVAQDKKGIAALELAKQISVSYSTAWLMLHKLRRAMRKRNERYVLQGLVEVDETYVGGKAEGTRGRGAARSRKSWRWPQAFQPGIPAVALAYRNGPQQRTLPAFFFVGLGGIVRRRRPDIPFLRRTNRSGRSKAKTQRHRISLHGPRYPFDRRF